MMQEEIWKDVVGYEGMYKVSNLGRVRSYKVYAEGRTMNPSTSNLYKSVELFNKGSKRELVHRLVAMAFLPNPDGLPEVNHRDENPSNNRLDNLEWISHKDNMNYGTRTARAMANTDREAHSRSKWKKVYAVYPDTNNVELFDSVMEAAKAIGVTPTVVSGVLNKRYTNSRGVKFFFEDEFSPSQRYIITPEQRTYVPERAVDGSLPIVAVNEQGEYTVYASVTDAANGLNTTTGGVSDAVNGNSYSIKQHVFYKLSEFDENNYKSFDPKHKAKQNFKGVVIIFPDNTYKIFNSINESASYLGLKSASSISDALKKPTKRVRGSRAVRLSEFDLSSEEFSNLTEKED